jgi:hypothetical protein
MKPRPFINPLIHQSINPLALANSAAEPEFAVLNNDASELDSEGWALIAPFGRHPKTRVFSENGQVKQQQFIQVLDNEAADTMVGKENSLFGKLKRALVGIPVFKGHGDLKDHDPKALANEQKIKLGVIDQIRKAERGIEAHFALDNDGAEAVRDGWKLPSALWLVQPIGNEVLADGHQAILARPFKLLSVALTQFPNISGVESLANQRDAGPQSEVQNAATAKVAEPTEKTTNTNDNTMKQLFIGWLAAQGIALANEATDQAVFEAFNKEMLNRSTSITALGNEKTTLNTTVATLTADRDAQQKRADEAAEALANEQTARKTERKHAATSAVDLAIQRGKLTVADREAKITALENSTAFDADLKALTEGKAVIKTEAVSGRLQAALGNEEQQTQAEYQQAFKMELVAAGQDPIRAHNNVMRLPQYAGLAAKLMPKKF